MPEPKENKGGGASAPRSARARAEYRRPEVTGVKYDRSALRDTEGGLTEAQKRAVAAEEAKIKARKTELGIIVDKDGKVLHRVPGSRTSVSFYGVPKGDIKDSVIVHNHPGYKQEQAFGDTLATRIGSPLSPQDVIFAAENDAAEIRVITSANRGRGGYVYSVRRPAGGWPSGVRATAAAVMEQARAEADRGYRRVAVTTSLGSDSHQVYRQRNSRVELMAQWHQMQELARRLGTTITRRRYNG